MKFVYPFGATPIDRDEADALIPFHIQTQKELNAFEHMNIALAIQWALAQKNILDTKKIIELHKRMFNQTWKWAGSFRKTQKNIGVEAYLIETEIYKLCKDIQFFLDNETYGIDEIAVRFHHRLVWIHPFPNGNGRQARLACDVLLRSLNQPLFEWGDLDGFNDDVASIENNRRKYIEALKEADQHDYSYLLAFVRNMQI